MHRLSIRRTSFAVALILARCGVLRQPKDDMQPPIGPTPSYDVLHKFGNHVNRLHDRGGANPRARKLCCTHSTATLMGPTPTRG